MQISSSRQSKAPKPSEQELQTSQGATQSTLPFLAAFGALVIGAIAMGVSPVFVRYAEVGPFASAFWRVATALPLLALWMAYEMRSSAGIDTSIKASPKAAIADKAVWLAGLFFAGDLFFWHLAIMNTTIANATLLSCLAPVWVLLLSGTFIGEPVGRAAMLGLGLCLGGAALLIGSSYSIAPDRLMGDIYGLITSIFFGLYFLAVRVARRRYGTGTLTLNSGIITATTLLLVTILSGQGLWPTTGLGLAALIALGVISHVGGQGLLALALGSLSATFSSLVIFIEALAAALFGWLVFSEILTPLQGLGGLFIMAGIWIARPKS
ncbi:MAG: DMT family transporter [Pseudomonadota bacterium]